MTLSTDIYIDKYIPPKMVMDKLMEIIEFPNYKYDETEFGGSPSLFGVPGQGANAWLIVRHNNGKLIEIDPEEAEWAYNKPHYIVVNLDTTYGASGGASNIHAYVIQELANWKLDTTFNVDFQNEFTGTYHSFDELYTFGDPELGYEGIKGE